MSLDFKKAFNSPFSEEKWYIKMVFPFVMTLLGIMTSTFYKNDAGANVMINLLTLFPSIILAGFYAQFAHNEIHDVAPILPELKAKIVDFLKYGFKLIGISIIYFSIVLVGSIISLAGLKTFNIFSVLGLVLIPIGLIIGFLLAVPAEGIFFDTFCFKAALDYKKAIELLSKVKMEIAVYAVICIFFVVFTSICNSIVDLFGFTIILLAAIITAIQFAIVNINAQIYKIAKARLG